VHRESPELLVTEEQQNKTVFLLPPQHLDACSLFAQFLKDALHFAAQNPLLDVTAGVGAAGLGVVAAPMLVSTLLLSGLGFGAGGVKADQSFSWCKPKPQPTSALSASLRSTC
jgi:hypothetical protein